jgi:hypothetical protein
MDPQTRVRTFIADYIRLHTRALTGKGRGARAVERELSEWKRAVAELDGMHFTEGGGRELASMLMSPPPHSPDREVILGMTSREGRVIVETRTDPEGLSPSWWEYEMAELAGDWRIRRIRHYLHDAQAPFLAEKYRSRFLPSSSLPPFDALAAEDHGFDGNLAFVNGRQVSIDARAGTIEVREVGMLHCSEGHLIVGDLGYDALTLSLIRQPIAPETIAWRWPGHSDTTSRSG